MYALSFWFIGFSFSPPDFIALNLFQKLEFTGKEQKYKALAEKKRKTSCFIYRFIQSTSLYNYFTGNESSTLGFLNVKKNTI